MKWNQIRKQWTEVKGHVREPLIVAAATIAVGCPVADRLRVAQRPTTAPHFRSEQALDEDGNLRIQVRRKLDTDRRLEEHNIRVAATDQGVVALYGNVPTEEERFLAGRLASDVSGVKLVYNEIRILWPRRDIPRAHY